MKFAAGFYQATEAFRRIDEHAAVMDSHTNELIAVTGPASDPEAVAVARLFAAAPALLAAGRAVLDGEAHALDDIRAAVEQATGPKRNEKQIPLPLYETEY